MDLKAIVATAEVLLQVLQKCEKTEQMNDAERGVVMRWLNDIELAIDKQQLAADESVVEQSPVQEQPVIESEPAIEQEQQQTEPEKGTATEVIIETEEYKVTDDEQEVFEVVIEHSKLKHEAVRSLYEDDNVSDLVIEADVTTEREPENLPEPEDFIEEQDIVLSPEDEKIINDLEVSRDINSSLQAGTPLSQLIGINDKFIIARDLFDGDTFAFNRTLATLDNFNDFDEALIYMHTTYPTWDTKSDGAQLLVGKLYAKLG